MHACLTHLTGQHSALQDLRLTAGQCSSVIDMNEEAAFWTRYLNSLTGLCGADTTDQSSGSMITICERMNTHSV